jgi:hypothetical protein
MAFVLGTLLSASFALNVGFATGFVATRTGANLAEAVLKGGSAAGASLALLIGAVAAYR